MNNMDRTLIAILACALVAGVVIGVSAARSLDRMADAQECELLFPAGEGDEQIYEHRGECLYPDAVRED